MLVSFDTMVLIWLAKQGTRKGQKTPDRVLEMHKRAHYMGEWIEENGHNVILSNIVISEFLRPLDEEKRNTVVATLCEKYNVLPFDNAAAKIAADLYYSAKNVGTSGENDRRVCMKADIMILATAKVHQVKRFYSNDSQTRKFAEIAGMEALDLPMSGSNLFSDKK